MGRRQSDYRIRTTAWAWQTTICRAAFDVRGSSGLRERSSKDRQSAWHEAESSQVISDLVAGFSTHLSWTAG
jgi:hypothetical protein